MMLVAIAVPVPPPIPKTASRPSSATSRCATIAPPSSTSLTAPIDPPSKPARKVPLCGGRQLVSGDIGVRTGSPKVPMSIRIVWNPSPRAMSTTKAASRPLVQCSDYQQPLCHLTSSPESNHSKTLLSLLTPLRLHLTCTVYIILKNIEGINKYIAFGRATTFLSPPPPGTTSIPAPGLLIR